MITEAQIKYLEDVLGIGAEAFAREGRQTFRTLVLVSHLSPAEEELLQKILSGIKIQAYIQSDREHPEAEHVIKFDSNVPGGRHPRGEQIWWLLPSLADMLGSSPEVGAVKKAAWAVLQRYKKELEQ